MNPFVRGYHAHMEIWEPPTNQFAKSEVVPKVHSAELEKQSTFLTNVQVLKVLKAANPCNYLLVVL